MAASHAPPISDATEPEDSEPVEERPGEGGTGLPEEELGEPARAVWWAGAWEEVGRREEEGQQ
jgi:hypothetical protein